MLSVRLASGLDAQLDEYCARAQVSKSAVVKTALANHLKLVRSDVTGPRENPFAAYRGKGTGRYTTEEVMRMTRGEDWNQA